MSKLESGSTSPPSPGVWIVYDGQCPFCTRFVHLLRLREAVGRVELVDARAGGPIVEEVVTEGLDLDEGMVLLMDGRIYHGADCMHRLAMLSTSSSLFNRVNAVVFRSPALTRALYPVLRTCRNLTLRMLGRSKIADSRPGSG